MEQIIIDMHTHSTASDGQYTPSEVVRKAKEKGCKIIAITDHDTIDGIGEARKCAEEIQINFCSGIEISAQASEEIHILGYFIDETNPTLVKKCKDLALSRERRAEKICKFLAKKNIEVDLQEIKSIAGSGVVARPHFAAYLQQHGYVLDRKEAFKKYLDTHEFHEEVEREKPCPQEAIELIHQAGGKAVLAHPGFIKKTEQELDIFIRSLREFGLDGLECFYSKHTEKQTKVFLEYAKKYNLKISCGSDFHGERVKPDVSLGICLNKNYIDGNFIKKL